MPKAIDVGTDVTTTHKISVGLLTATAIMVVVSAMTAIIYTLTQNAAPSAGSITEQYGDGGRSSTPSTDRTFGITP